MQLTTTEQFILGGVVMVVAGYAALVWNEIGKLRELRHGLREEISVLSGRMELMEMELDDHKKESAAQMSRFKRAIKVVVNEGVRQLKEGRKNDKS